MRFHRKKEAEKTVFGRRFLSCRLDISQTDFGDVVERRFWDNSGKIWKQPSFIGSEEERASERARVGELIQ